VQDEEIKTRICSDLSQIGLPVYEVDIEIRPYSKTFYGRYFPTCDENLAKPKVYIYPYDEKGNIDYDTIFCKSAVHEMIHHLQYISPFWQRKRGVMHDEQFWKMYNFYVERAEKLGVVRRCDYELAQ